MEISIQAVLQGVINGLALGWIYVLMAMGLTLIYGIMNIMQFSHGEIYMLGAYLTYYLTVVYRVPLFLAAILCVIVMAAFGLLIERFLFRPVKGEISAPFIVATGLILILQSGAVTAFGVYRRKLPSLAQGTIEVMGALLPKDRLMAVAVAMFLACLLYLFIKKTKYGLAMVACAQNSEGAISQGINPSKISAMVMAMGCALAAAGGALAGSIFSMSPAMGLPPLVKGITIIVLGGMGSLPGAIIAGMLLGIVDSLVPILFGITLTSILPLLIVIIVLIIRPQGFFGHAE